MISPLIADCATLKSAARQLIPMQAPAASKAACADRQKLEHASRAPIV
jgi:hypothetical protein